MADAAEDRDDLRADLESAIGAVEGEITPDPTPTPTETAETPSEGAETQNSSQAGDEFTEKDEFLDGYDGDEEKYPNLTKNRVSKAPDGWRPAAREGWEQLPEAVRREIHRREHDINMGLQNSADSRKAQDRLNDLHQTYNAALSAEGVSDPLDAVESLLQVASQLRFGTPQDKAGLIAKMVNDYQVDIKTLDQALTTNINNGQRPPPEAAPIDPALEARLAPMQQFMEQMNQRMGQAEQNRAAQADAEIAQFSQQAEFLEDVRLDMADLLDMASQRGRQMSLEEAYETACQMNPEIRNVLAQRQQQQNVMSQNQHMQNKIRAANVSVAGTPTDSGPMGAQTDGSIRSDLMAAISQLEDS